MECVVDAVVGEVPFDGRGTIGEGEDGWKFDKLELIQGIAVGWEESFEFRVVSFREVRSFGEGSLGMSAGIMANKFPIAEVLMQ